MGTSITFKRPDGKDTGGYLAQAARADAPGVVVIQEWWGLQDQIKGICDRFALAGFDALAPDLYNGVVVPYHDTDAAGKEMNSLNFIDATEQNVRGAAPPDLSLMAKARGYDRPFPQFIFDAFIQFQEKGPNYITAVLQGFDPAPAGFTLPEGAYYNTYFPGHAIKMPKPLSDGQVTFDDGSPATVAQYAKDVTTFLMWTAEPHMEERKRLGMQVFVFLIIFTGLMYFTKKKVWADAH